MHEVTDRQNMRERETVGERYAESKLREKTAVERQRERKRDNSREQSAQHAARCQLYVTRRRRRGRGRVAAPTP